MIERPHLNLIPGTAIAIVTADNPTLNAVDITISATGSPPSGPAGGILNGTYPNPGLVDTGVTPGGYGDATHVPQLVVDVDGRLISVSEVLISGGGSGTVYRVGSGVPSVGLGSIGDLYEDLANADLYQKQAAPGLTPAYRSQSGGGTSASTSHGISLPPGFAAGDVLILIFYNATFTGGPLAPSTPSGWTLQAQGQLAPYNTYSLFTKVATGSETSFNVSVGLSSWSNWAMMAYSSGAGAVDAVTNGTAQGNNPTVPSVTTTVDNGMIVAAVLASTASSTASPSAGWTERVELFGVSVNSVMVYAMEKAQPTAGASPVAIPTIAGNTWPFAVALKGTPTGSGAWVKIEDRSVSTDLLWDLKGDLAVATGADAAVRLPVGTNDQVLVADSTQTVGMRWGGIDGGSA